MDKLKVHFVVPGFNIEKNIKSLVAGFRSQNNDAWSCTIIDDISKDETWTKLKEEVSYDKRFKIVEKLGEGTYGNVFKAIDLTNNQVSNKLSKI